MGFLGVRLEVPLKFADVSILCKKSVFYGQNSALNQSNSARAVLETF